MIFEFGEVASTNTSALDLLKAGEKAPFLVRADAQIGGRGRGGKVWSSPVGTFYGTFVVRPFREAREAAQLSFVAAVALGEVLTAQGLDPQLKWPNDVLIDGAKVSGILLEMHGPHVLIGMGVNVVSHPAVPGYASTSLRDEGVDLSPQAFGEDLSTALHHWIARWETEGFAAIREAWLQRGYGLGQPLKVRLPGEKILEGRFQGLDSDGALLLAQDAGVIPIHAGDLYFSAAGD